MRDKILHWLLVWLLVWLVALGIAGPMFFLFAAITPADDYGTAAVATIGVSVAITAYRLWQERSKKEARWMSELSGPLISWFLGASIAAQVLLVLSGWSVVVRDGQLTRAGVLLPIIPGLVAAALRARKQQKDGQQK